MTISLINSATSRNSTTITVPSVGRPPVPGDLIVYGATIQQSGTTAPTVPTGFTAITSLGYETGATDILGCLAYKIADGTEGGAVLTGDSGGAATRVKGIAVFHSDAGPITAVSVAGKHDEGTSGDPAAQVIDASGQAVPLIALALYAWGNGTVATAAASMSPAETGSIDDINADASGQKLKLKYKIYNSSPADVTVDMADAGLNVLISCRLGLTIGSRPSGLSLISAVNAYNSLTITVPSGSDAPQAGDVLVYAETRTSLSQPALFVPWEWGQVNRFTNSAGGVVFAARISDGTEGGTAITGSAANGAQDKHIAIFRHSSGPIKQLTFNDTDAQVTVSDPTAQVITSGSGVAPLIAFGVYCTDGSLAGRSMSPGQDAESFGTVSVLRWKAYNSSPADVTVDIDDAGKNILASFYLGISLLAPTVSLVAFGSSGDSSTVTVPSGGNAPQAGDLLLFSDVKSSVGVPTMVLPTGFTTIDTNAAELGLTDLGHMLAYKISDGTEGGTTITGTVGGAGTGSKSKLLGVYRSNQGPITAVSVQGAQHETSNADKTNQTIGSSAGASPVLAVALYGGINDIQDRGFLQAPNSSIHHQDAAQPRSELKVKCFDTAPANVVVSEVLAEASVLASAYLNLQIGIVGKHRMMALFY